MLKLPAPLLCDYYKISHIAQFPPQTEYTYTNITPRGTREDVEDVVVFGTRYFIEEYLVKYWNENFFYRPLHKVLDEMKEILLPSIGEIDYQPYIDLHRLGYLPLEIRSLPEGSNCPLRVPYCTIHNTHPNFYWLTNAIESHMQCVLWLPVTSATTAREYRKIVKEWAEISSDCPEFVDWQCHDFSYRGMSSFESACISGAAHLLSFNGTDTVPALPFLIKHYGATYTNDSGLPNAGSVPASEHAIVSAYGEKNEVETLRHFIEDVYPTGIFSMVSDTWNWPEVICPDGGYLAQLKDKIMARDGKLVVRPDSSDKTPLEVLCGDPDPDPKYDARHRLTMQKGLINCLAEIFGTTTNSKGFKDLDPHIGGIYGEAITIPLLDKICSNLIEQGYSSTNFLYGVGSFSYQYKTRDSHMIAAKGTWIQINGEGKAIFKDPVTGSGFKKSAKGLLKVVRDGDSYKMVDGFKNWEEYEADEHKCELVPVFRNGISFNGHNKFEYIVSRVR